MDLNICSDKNHRNADTRGGRAGACSVLCDRMTRARSAPAVLCGYHGEGLGVVLLAQARGVVGDECAYLRRILRHPVGEALIRALLGYE